MKIRTGFVSNSSSSSFCIYGTYLEEQEEISGIDMDEDYEKIDKFWDKFEKKASKLGVEVYRDRECNCVYLGRSYSTIEDDETGKSFKEATEKSLEKLLDKKVTCEEHCTEIST